MRASERMRNLRWPFFPAKGQLEKYVNRRFRKVSISGHRAGGKGAATRLLLPEAWLQEAHREV